jgi:hypothetical protein
MLLLLVMATATSAADDREPALLPSLSWESCMPLGKWWDGETAASLSKPELLASCGILLSVAVSEQRIGGPACCCCEVFIQRGKQQL